jgi:Flp pilus assembly pilin Flp
MSRRSLASSERTSFFTQQGTRAHRLGLRAVEDLGGQHRSGKEKKMQNIMNRIRRAFGKGALVTDQRGLSSVEYVVLLVLVVAAAIGLWVKFGGQVTQKLGDVNSEMGKVTFTPAPAGH